MISLREYDAPAPRPRYPKPGELKNLTATVEIKLEPPTTLDAFAFLHGIIRQKGETKAAFKARFYAYCDAHGITRPTIP